uniref:Protein FAM160B1-like n=1 Tax=Saccoglossus kowalevskii TaxID=10224 RepID=A0ABM0M470_SACKO
LDLYSEDEDDCAFPGKRALISLLSWFDYCDELIKNAHPLIGKLLAKEIKERFYVPVLEPLLLQASEVGILTCTALLIKLVKMTTSESLLSVTVYFLLGDATAKETPGEASHKLRHRFIERCDHLSDEISILSLKLFEVLLLKPHEHIINNLVLRNLAPRTYHASSELLATEEYFESDIDTTEDDVSERTDSPMFDDSDLPPLELEAFDDPVLADDFPVEIPDQLFDVEKMENQILEKLAVENQILNNDFEDKGEHKEEEQTVVEVVNHDNFAEEVAAVEKATKLSPRSQTSSNAASSIASGSIVMDVTSNASGSVLVEERPGIHAVVNSYLSLVPEYAKSSSAGDSGYDTYLRDAHRQFRECSVQCLRWEWPTYPKPVDKIDYSHAFYEGVFLKVLFDKLSQLLDQPYEVNLQLTSVMAKLAQFPHPHTHEFMLDPYLRLEPGCRSLYTVLCRLVSDLKSRVKAMPHFQIQCIQVRKQLTEMTEEESSSYIELMEGVIVLEEFCKELAAIAFVKAHAESGRI